jgi:AcrR family transcriptional regulator
MHHATLCQVKTKRPYTMKRRAERLDETRQRIVDATVALHEEVGPARTTVTAIAKRAGVSRPTVYNQFPDDGSLFAACSGHWREQHPMPELEGGELEEALAALYAYFGENKRMLENIDRDARLLPALADQYGKAVAIRRRAADRHAERLAPGDERVRALNQLAFSFSTWQTLDNAGLDATEAASLVASLAHAAAASVSV